MSIENPNLEEEKEIAPDAEDTHEVEDRTEKDAILLIKSKIEELKALKNQFADRKREIEGWGDVTSADRNLMKKDEESLKTDKYVIQIAIDNRFNALENEIRNMGEIKSLTGTYSAEDIISKIDVIRREIRKEEGSPVTRTITRANNLRGRVSELVELSNDLKSI